jgi:FAD/FMN-containing dehydrogenase
MNRRNLLRKLAAAPLLSLLWRHSPAMARDARLSKSSLGRRVRPSDASWPAPAKWEELKQLVGGHLIPPGSPMAACQSQADGVPCQELLKNLHNPYYVGDQPDATQSSGWVDAWMSAPSTYAVAARNTADVVAAVNFAREHDLRLVVKGGGHSYQGTSNAPDSLLVWTRAMNGIEIHDAFVPQGCSEKQSPQPAVTIEAGAVWMDAYDAVTTKAGRYVQGGGCATVGVAGLIQSGGFGSFSKNFGTAAAGLLEAEVVTADGAVRIANACTNSDLFWGLKGGGGGTLGIVTKVTLKTHELPTFFGGALATIKATSDAAFRRLIAQFIRFCSESLINPHWGETVTLRNNTLAVTMVYQGLDQKEASKTWQPFFDWVAESPQDFTIASAPFIAGIPARLWWNAGFRKKVTPDTVHADDRPGAPESHIWWAGDQGQIGIFWHGYHSAWLPADLLKEDQQERLADALFKASAHWDVELHFNKGLAGAPADALAAAKDTAMNPAVLNAFALAIIAGGGTPAYPGVSGHEPDLTAARRRAAEIAKSMDELLSVASDPGSYVSESDYFERNWQRSFWGANYARLQTVKAKYDPAGLFFVHHGVGSEEWSADGFTRLSTRTT